MLGGGNMSLTTPRARASRSCDRFRCWDWLGFENCGCPESVNYVWTMPIQSFSFPLPETRFFQAGQHVYKFKIRGGNNCSEVKVMGEEFVNRELENAIRAVLANLDLLQPFTTTHFTVYPYKSKWKRVSKFKFEKMSGEKLSAYPFLVTVYLENNTHTEMCVEECWTPVRAGGVPLLPASSHECLAKRRKTEPPHWGTLTPQQRDCLIMQGPQSHIHHELLRPGETEAKNGDGKADCVVSDSQTPQSTVGGSVTGGSETMDVSGGHGEEEVHPGAVEEGDPEDPDLEPKSHVRPGLLARLVSQVFPFSMFFRES
ncbi:membrane-anchored junction protein isoform X2 [Salvelinus fontinalis]|uniref:membrane-anchored junction protein isoform X2 n=1 Tax=Salvelinus fontinalis TaxID=8038 RepID=UPI002485D0E9|nr:membrane-anchored junction protein isoform X2 [Salvelinus fontinalis]